MVGAADNVRHAHVDVVDYHAEVIGRHAIRAQQNEIFDLGVGELDAAKNRVLECGTPTFGHSKAYGRRFARLGPLLASSRVMPRQASRVDASFGDASARAAAPAVPSCRSSSTHDRC